MFKLYYGVARAPWLRTLRWRKRVRHTRPNASISNGTSGSPEYLAVNPKGRVPALMTDRGILTETPAILAVIAQSFPQANLAPLADPFAFARAQAFNSYLCSTAHVRMRTRGGALAGRPTRFVRTT